MTSRRQFITLVPVAGTVLVAGRSAFAQAAALDPKDPQAVALGYVADSTKADKAKYPKHTPDQVCSGCQLYQGTAASGACTLFQGKQVVGKGWCSAWVKKP